MVPSSTHAPALMYMGGMQTTPRATIGPGAHGRSAGNDANAIARRKAADGIGVLVDEREAALGASFKHTKAEAEQDALLDPDVDPPAGRGSGVGRSGADVAPFQGAAEDEERFHGCGVAHRCGTSGEVSLNRLL